MQRGLKHRAQHDQLLRISHGIQQHAFESFSAAEAAQRAMRLNADYHNWLNTWFRFHPPEIPAVRIHSDEVHETTEGTVVRVQQELAERKREQDLLKQNMDVERLIDLLTHGEHVKPSGKKPERTPPPSPPGAGGGRRGGDDDDDGDDGGPGGGRGRGGGLIDDTAAATEDVPTEEFQPGENEETERQAEGQQQAFANIQLPSGSAVEDPSQDPHNLGQVRQENRALARHAALFGRLPETIPEETEGDPLVDVAQLDEEADIQGAAPEAQAEGEGVTEASRIETAEAGEQADIGDREQQERAIAVGSDLARAEMALQLSNAEQRERERKIKELEGRLQELEIVKQRLVIALNFRPTREETRSEIEKMQEQQDALYGELLDARYQVTEREEAFRVQRQTMREEFQERLEQVQSTIRDEAAQEIAEALLRQQVSSDVREAELNALIRDLRTEMEMQSDRSQIGFEAKEKQLRERQKELENEKRELLHRRVAENEELVNGLRSRIEELEIELAISQGLQSRAAERPSTSAASEEVTRAEELTRERLREYEALVAALKSQVSDLRTQLRAFMGRAASAESESERKLQEAASREAQLAAQEAEQRELLEEMQEAQQNRLARMRQSGQRVDVAERMGQTETRALQEQLLETRRQLQESQRQQNIARREPRAADLRTINSLERVIQELQVQVQQLMVQNTLASQQPPQVIQVPVQVPVEVPVQSPLQTAVQGIQEARADREAGARDVARQLETQQLQQQNIDLRTQLAMATQRIEQERIRRELGEVLRQLQQRRQEEEELVETGSAGSRTGKRPRR